MKEELKVLEHSLDLIKSFLEKLAGPAAEELGLILQDKVKLYRFKNQIKIFQRAKKILDEANLKPKPIPLRTLVPLLDGASLEDNEYLANKWSALIANAAIWNLSKDNHPSYSKILMELSPIDALLLDKIYEEKSDIIWKPFKEKFARDNSLTLEEVAFCFENLFRLGLIYNTNKGLSKGEFSKYFIKACSNP